jgi:hypothetical protein
MVDFVEGFGLDGILQMPNARLMRPDVNEEVIKVIFRQTLDFLLRLHKLDFPYIGSLALKSGIGEPTIPSQPLNNGIT